MLRKARDQVCSCRPGRFTGEPREFITLGHVSIATSKGVPDMALSGPPVIRILFSLLCNTSPASFMHFCTCRRKAKKKKSYTLSTNHMTRQLLSKWTSCWTTCSVMFVVLSPRTFYCPTSVLLSLPSDVKRTMINRILAIMNISVQKLHQFSCSLRNLRCTHK